MGNVPSNFEDNRAYDAGKGSKDSAAMVNRAGGDLGNDPRRHAASIVIERKITDHDMSGYNHAYTSNSDMYARQQENKAMGLGTPHPDGTYSK